MPETLTLPFPGTVTIPGRAAFEALAYAEAVVSLLVDIVGGDANDLYTVQDGFYMQLRKAIQPTLPDGMLDDDDGVTDAIMERSRELNELLASAVKLDVARRVTLLERDRDRFEIYFASLGLEEKRRDDA
jgi:hypothetical protein